MNDYLIFITDQRLDVPFQRSAPHLELSSRYDTSDNPSKIQLWKNRTENHQTNHLHAHILRNSNETMVPLAELTQQTIYE